MGGRWGLGLLRLSGQGLRVGSCCGYGLPARSWSAVGGMQHAEGGVAAEDVSIVSHAEISRRPKVRAGCAARHACIRQQYITDLLAHHSQVSYRSILTVQQLPMHSLSAAAVSRRVLPPRIEM